MGECILMRDLDKELLQKAIEEFKLKDSVCIKLDHPCETLDYLKDYNVKEIGEYWYDADPPECKTCHFQIEGKYPCDSCPFLAVWKTSKDCLSKLTWVDIWGPQFWGITQEKTNEMYDHMIVDLLEDGLGDRFYLLSKITDVSTDIMIYVYARDIKSCDYGFVLEKKEENEK